MTLVSASSPVAGVVEVHEMVTQDGVMKMRAMPGLPLAPGKVTELKPGGYHIMLIGLKAPLVEGKLVPLTLTFAKAGAVKVELKVEAAGAAEPAHSNHGG